MIRAIIFDLDDTLYPEIDYVKSGFRAVSRFLNQRFEIDYSESLMELFEEDRIGVFDRLIKRHSIPVESEELIDLYRYHMPDIHFYSDVLPLIEYIKAKGIKLGIITDGRPEGQRLKLKVLKCYDSFDKIIITDELGGIEYRKPHPLSYEIMAESLNVNYEEMMYIGDNPSKDFDIAKKYPIKTVWIKRKGYVIHNSYSDIANIDYIIESLDEFRGSVYEIV